MAANQSSATKSKVPKKWTALAACVLVLLIFFKITLPLALVAEVYWVYGFDGYHKQGIRVVGGKPRRFSNGELVPAMPDIVTSFSALIVAGVVTNVLVVLGHRGYGLFRGNSKANAA